jgi:hypothetical protein
MPVIAATADMSTARPSHASQLMTNDRIHVDPTLRTPWKKVVRQLYAKCQRAIQSSMSAGQREGNITIEDGR